MRWIVSAILVGRRTALLSALFFCAAASPALAKGDTKSTPSRESTRTVTQKHVFGHRLAKSDRKEEVHRRAHGRTSLVSLATAHHHQSVHQHRHAFARLQSHRQLREGAIAERPSDRQVGQASWYGREHIGRRTATGERFDPDLLTAAHPTLPLNTTVRVKNLVNGRVVTVRINDRSAQTGHRIIDLSPRAADMLDMRRAGVAPVVVEKVSPELALAR
jgi:rare lipoprotein A